MTSPVETTAAMTATDDRHDSAPTAGARAADPRSLQGSASNAEGVSDVAVGKAARSRNLERREWSPNTVTTLYAGLVTTVLGALIGLMMWQFSELGARIDANGARIEYLGAELRSEFRAEIGSVRSDINDLEMGLRAEFRDEIASVRSDMDDLETRLRAEIQTGFAAINAVLLDHTDRLARLETAAGLPRVTAEP